jgi:DegV family protein with EDD domain
MLRRASPRFGVSVSSCLSMSPSVRVVTDSTADLPADLAAELGITVVPANLHFGLETFLDGPEMSRQAFYERLMRDPVLPTTSSPAVGVFTDTYRRLVQESRDAGEELEGIVSVHLASRLSAVYNAARLGALDVPEVAVRLVDSCQISIGTGWLAILAARAARAGRRLEEIAAFVEDRVPRLRLIAALSTLDYVRRSGRLGRAGWLVGTLLSIKPIIEIRDGEVLPPRDLVRTRSRALDRLVEIAESLAPFEELSVMHAHAPELGQVLLERLSAVHPPERILLAEVGVTVGTYAGPGAVGIIGIVRG